MRFWPDSFPDKGFSATKTSLLAKLNRAAGSALFGAAYAVGCALSLMTRGRQRVLVIRTDGVGEALLFEPALENLAQTVSPRVLHMWAPAESCELLALSPSVRKFVAIPCGNAAGIRSASNALAWRIKLGLNLGRWTFDKVVYLTSSPDPLGNWLFTSVRAVERWLTPGDTLNQTEAQSRATQQRATKILENRPGNSHEMHRNEYLVSQWAGRVSLRRPKVVASPQARQRAEKRLEDWRGVARSKGAAQLVGVCPAAATPVKTYDLEKWVIALRQLWLGQRVMPVLLGSRTDAAALRMLEVGLQKAQVPLIKLSVPLPLNEVSAIICGLDGVLSVDSPIAHLALAQSIPSVVLVGGGNPQQFFPWPDAKRHVTLSIDMPCSGCNHHCVMQEAACITHITPEEITRAFMRVSDPATAAEELQTEKVRRQLRQRTA